MKFNLILISAASLVALSGCASTSGSTFNSEGCTPVDQYGCASMQEAYYAARSADPKKLTEVRNVFDVRAYADITPGGVVAKGSASQGSTAVLDQPVVGGGLPYPDQKGTGGMPVFKQPQVLRVFVKPYVDADGNLRSGEQVFTATPGEWAYGTMKKPGSGAAVTLSKGANFGPADGRVLGFTPQVGSTATITSKTTVVQGTPPAPAATVATVPTATPLANPNATTTTTTKQQTVVNNEAGITQPYQRLSN